MSKTRSKKHEKDKLSLILGGIIFLVFLGFTVLFFTIKPDNTAEIELASQNSIQHEKNKFGTIKIVEFADIQCPACSKYHQFLKNYIKKDKRISFEFKHFPLNSIHKNAELMSKYAIAISIVNKTKFWLFLDYAYRDQREWSKLSHDKLHVYMKDLLSSKIKLNYNRVFDKLDSKEVLAKLASDKIEAKKSRLRGTPSFFVNDKIIVTPGLTKESWDKVIKNSL